MKWRTIALAPIIPAAVVLGVISSRHWPRRPFEARADAAEVQVAPLRTASTAPAVAAPRRRALTLPGDLVPSREAVIYARATGYVSRWKVDIGDRVRAGEVLAELDTPDLEQQLDQARATVAQKQATLGQADANLDYARVTAVRQDGLQSQGLVSKQAQDQADTQREVAGANVEAARADLAAARASVRQLTQLVEFGHVVAPFSGRVTDRLIDVGSLVMAGGSAGAEPLFHLAATDPIRTFVQVPQSYAATFSEGAAATVRVREVPNHPFEGRVTRSAGALDPVARTLKVEIDIPNPSGELLGGMYADVTIDVTPVRDGVEIPASALIADARGTQVATVDGGGVVHLARVTPGVDDGARVQITDGLRAGERVWVSPAADVSDGMRVVATD